jgi:hypothetical protein
VGANCPWNYRKIQNSRTLWSKFFDVDGRRSFGERLPTGILQEAAESKALPVHLRRDGASSWLRRHCWTSLTPHERLVPTLKTLIPELKPLLMTTRELWLTRRVVLGDYVWLKTRVPARRQLRIGRPPTQ